MNATMEPLSRGRKLSPTLTIKCLHNRHRAIPNKKGPVITTGPPQNYLFSPSPRDPGFYVPTLTLRDRRQERSYLTAAA